MAAPSGDGLGHAVKEALILVQNELVESDMTTFAGEGVWVGRKGIDPATVGELEDIGRGVGAWIKKEFAEISGADAQEFGPTQAIFELEFGLELVAGGNESVEASLFEANHFDQPVGVGIGKADLARFDGELEGGVILDPGALRWVEVGALTPDFE